MTITYTVQLRYNKTNFLGYGPVRPDGSHSVTFGTTDYLSEVTHFNSYSEALATAQSKYTNLSEDYVIITSFSQPVEKRYEVWITLPCKNGLRTYVLSGHNSFTPIMDYASDLQPLHFSCEQNAQKYADSLELTDYRIMQLSDEF